MNGIPGILLMTGTHNVPWTLECLGSSSDGQETGPGEEVEKSGEMWAGGEEIRCGELDLVALSGPR